MRKVFTLIVLLSFPVLIFSSNYRINNAEIDNLFNSASEISLQDISFSTLSGVNSNDIISIVDEKEPLIAWLCTFTGYLGICGIHRLYLGTELLTFIAYFITGGGCGIVQTIDWIVLLIELIDEHNFSNYVDNPKFFMWLD